MDFNCAGTPTSNHSSGFRDVRYHVYILASRRHGTLYIGITNSLERRTWYHRFGNAKSFTKIYKVDRLVYYERFNDARSAITREKELKGWRREKKNELVRAFNPKWKDLAKELFDLGSRKVTRRERCE